METDFHPRLTKNSPFLDKAVKERTAWKPGKGLIPITRWGLLFEPAIIVHKTKMARNCEKKLVGLNRLWLEKQRKGSNLELI